MNGSSKGRLQHILSEREKELDALFQLAQLFSQPTEDIAGLLRRTLGILRNSMQYPALAQVEITVDGNQYALSKPGSAAQYFQVERSYSIEKELSIKVSYRLQQDPAESPPILDGEKRLLYSAADLLANALQREEMEQVLRQSAKALQEQTKQLEEKNIALREILSLIEFEKQKILANARMHISTYILPSLQRLKHNSTLDEDSLKRLEQLEGSLEDLFNNRENRMRELTEQLTPREIEICTLIRNGMSTKDISSHLHITPATVERHRNTIRKKLGLSKTSVNLVSYLRSHD